VANYVIAGLTIAAIVLGPIIALQLQKKLDTGRDAKNRKLYLFKTLMSYRATPLSPNFVQALNLIDVEFTSGDEKEKAIRVAWKVLLDHLSSDQSKPGSFERTTDLISKLLLAMGKCLGYDFDEVYLKKGAYYPLGHSKIEEEQNTLRRELIQLLEGNRRLPIATFEQKFPDLADQKKEEPPA
jgi:hypothetical protein